MRKLLVILFLLNLSTEPICQIYFNRSYDLFLNNADGFVPIYTDSVNYYLGGSGYENGFRKNVILITDLNGDTIKTIKFGRDSATYNTGYSLIVDSTGFIFVGQENYQAISRPYAARINHNFDTVWTSNRWPIMEGNFTSVIKKKHHYIYAGTKETGLSGNDYLDGLIQCIDSSGNIIWQKIINNGQAEAFYSIDTSGSGFILSGFQDSPTNSWNIYVVKTDSIGNILLGWPKVFASSDSEAAWVKTLSDGNYLVYGGWQGGGSTGYAHIRKLDQNGNTLWIQNLQGPSTTIIINSFTDALELPNGDLVFTGSFFDPQTNNPSGWIVKTDAMGNELWRRTLRLRTNDHYLYGIISTPDGGFALSGALWPDGPGTTQDGWIVKLDSMGCVISGCSVGIEEEDFISDVIVYPNPSNGKFFIETDYWSNATYELFDLNGKLINTAKLNSNRVEITIPFETGIFVLKIQNPNGIFTKKIIIH